MIRYLIVVYSLTVYACGPMPVSPPKAYVVFDSVKQVEVDCPCNDQPICEECLYE